MKMSFAGATLALLLAAAAWGQEVPRRYYSGVALDLGGNIPWVARHDMTSESYGAEHQKWSRGGYRLYSITASPRLPNRADVRFAAVWVKDGKGIASEAYHDQTQEEFLHTLAKIKSAKKMRPWQVTGYIDRGNDRVASIFVNDGVTDWFAENELTDAKFQQALSQWQAKGYRPTCTTGYATVRGTRFALVMVKDDKKTDWEIRRNLSLQQFRQEHFKLTRAGYLPSEVCGYPLNNGVGFSGVFIKDAAKPRFNMQHGFSDQEHRNWITYMEKEKLVPVNISVCSIGGTLTTAGTTAPTTTAPTTMPPPPTTPATKPPGTPAVPVGPSPIKVEPAKKVVGYTVCSSLDWTRVDVAAGKRWWTGGVPGKQGPEATTDSLVAVLKKYGFETQFRRVEGAGGSVRVELFARLTKQTKTPFYISGDENMTREMKAIADMVYGGPKAVGKQVYSFSPK